MPAPLISPRSEISPPVARSGLAGLTRQLPRVLVAAAALGAAVPLLAGPLPATHDGLHHLFRLFELDRCLRAWHLYPRLFPDMGFGYGYPVLNFYSPLSYYFAWMWTALGAGYIGGLKAAHVIAILAASASMYLWASTFLPPSGAFLAAAAYTYFPYRVADIYLRGALAEAVAFAWPPLILWLLARYRGTGRSVWVPALALALAGFVLTHSLTAIMFAPALVLYAILLFGSPLTAQGARSYLRLAAATAAGIGLSGFFWLPALLENRYVLAGTVSGLEDLQPLLQPLRQWLSPYLLHRYTPHQGVAAQHPLSLAQGLTAAAGLAAGLCGWPRRARELRAALVSSMVLSAVALWLQTPSSRHVWEALPPLHYLQFPWRLQAVLCLSLAVPVGCLALLPRFESWRWALAIVVSATIAATSMLGLRLEPAHLPTAEVPLKEEQVNLDGLLDYDFQTALWLREHGGRWLLEYLPVWALAGRDSFFLPTAEPEAMPPFPEGCTLAVVEDAPLRTEVRLSCEQPVTLVLHRFYFPGWQAITADQSLAVLPTGRLGLASIEVPAGDHVLTVRLGRTTPRLLGVVLSIAAAVALALWAAREQLWKPMAALGLSVAVFVALVAVRAWSHSTIVRPQLVQVQVGDAVRLIGHASTWEGDRLTVWLYWQALQGITEDHKVFVHATDASGDLLTQHDGQPGNEFSPTSRWLPGELVVDRHVLQPDAAPTQLYAGMYRWPEMTNLPAASGKALYPDGRIPLGAASPP